MGLAKTAQELHAITLNGETNNLNKLKEKSNDCQKVSWPQYAIIFPNLEVFIYPNVIKWGILADSLG